MKNYFFRQVIFAIKGYEECSISAIAHMHLRKCMNLFTGGVHNVCVWCGITC